MAAKHKLYFLTERFSKFRKVEGDEDDLKMAKLTKDVDLVKSQILQINDKFDYLVAMMISAKAIRVKNIC